MVSRISSTVVLWAAILGSLWFFHAHAAVTLVAVLATLTLHEFYGMMVKLGARPFHWMGLACSVLMTAGPYYLEFYYKKDAILAAESLPTAVLVAALVICCVRVLGERDPTNRVETIGATMLGLLYVPFLLHYLVRILMRDADANENLVLCLWVVAVSKFCDVGALLTGLALGRHKMAPEISPKKTWEGAVGGVVVSTGVGAGVAFFASANLPENLTPGLAALIALPLALTTIVSDLIESVLKRRAGTKDTGQLIPGIGGAFDLTDSLILTAPVAFFIFQFFD